MSEQDIIYEIKQSVSYVRFKRLLILLPMAALLMWAGVKIVPDGSLWTFNVEGNASFLRVAFGHFLIAVGIWNFVIELVYAYLARGNGDEWHILLTSDRLTWQVPKHPYGREKPFDIALVDIKHSEFRRDRESLDRSYWLHPRTGKPIRLNDASGIYLDFLLEKLTELGVPYEETEV